MVSMIVPDSSTKNREILILLVQLRVLASLCARLALLSYLITQLGCVIEDGAIT